VQTIIFKMDITFLKMFFFHFVFFVGPPSGTPMEENHETELFYFFSLSFSCLKSNNVIFFTLYLVLYRKS